MPAVNQPLSPQVKTKRKIRLPLQTRRVAPPGPLVWTNHDLLLFPSHSLAINQIGGPPIHPTQPGRTLAPPHLWDLGCPVTQENLSAAQSARTPTLSSPRDQSRQPQQQNQSRWLSLSSPAGSDDSLKVSLVFLLELLVRLSVNIVRGKFS
jgi:hypothetical protein